ncbi:MAG TPA: chorismate-binding protein, partial [Vicinamibacterales bacterium]|nr:chorismate-binding protein [Vicinamibacterales bacterium]
MKTTSFDEFRELAQGATFVPVCRELVADLLTPVSAFLKVAEDSDHAFLLESVEGGEQVGRYSFLGKDPFLVLRAGPDGAATIERGGVRTASGEPFLVTLRRLMADFKSPVVPSLPRFTGGAVGFLGYDAVPWFERVPLQRGEDGQAAAATFMLFDTVLAFDHVRHRILMIANARIGADGDLESQYRFACARLDFLERELQRQLSASARPDPGPLGVRANLSREQFEAAVRAGQEHIAAGDVYQVVLSQRFDVDADVEPFSVYRALRHVNPSPYMFFLRLGGRSLIGASPEMLVRVEGRRVETHPIAGTRPRGATEADDLHLAEELKASEKERAEHVMLVDLGRNDVGRVSEYGTVRVPQFMGLERYSHVMHLVSVVEGRLAAGCDALDALVSCFPAGTVSGAP